MPGPKLKREPNPNIFDLQTHKYNANGQVVEKNNYRLFSVNGEEYFERPVGSGNLWSPDNQPIGRVTVIKDERGRSVGKSIDKKAEHKDFKVDVSPEQAAQFELAETRARNQALEKELAAIKQEKAVKAMSEGKKVVGDQEFPIDSEPKELAEGAKPEAKEEGKAPTPDNVHAERLVEAAERIKGAAKAKDAKK